VHREPPPPPAGVTAERDIVAGQSGGVPIHVDVAYPSAPSPTPLPALLYVHGGGWAAGHGPDGLGFCYAAARRGYFSATVDYRLSNVAKWPAQIQDCKLAVRWLRANAAKYNVDPNKIGAVGHSAGGHLVACLGTMDDPKFEGDGGYAGVSSKVQAVSDWSGPADLTDGNFGNGSDSVTPETRMHDIGLLDALIGFTFDQRPDLWKDASPIMWIKPNDPPFQVVHGSVDEIVSVKQGEEFAAALQKAGVPTELIIIQNGGHGLGPRPGGPPAVPDHVELMKRVFAFFDKNLKGK
jgi:acetyl esterase/lipase